MNNRKKYLYPSWPLMPKNYWHRAKVRLFVFNHYRGFKTRLLP
jgi:hypothetical protein